MSPLLAAPLPNVGFSSQCGRTAAIYLFSTIRYLVGYGEQRRRHREADRLDGLEVDHQRILPDCWTRRSVGQKA
jgi:hypothetical protein